MKKIAIFSLAVCLMLIPIMGVSCDSDDKSAEEAFCDTLPALEEAIQNVNSITIQTDIEQVEEYRDQLKSAWEDTSNAAEKLASEKWGEVEAAYAEFLSSLSSISDESSLEEAIPAIKAAWTQFKADLDAIESTTCNSE